MMTSGNEASADSVGDIRSSPGMTTGRSRNRKYIIGGVGLVIVIVVIVLSVVLTSGGGGGGGDINNSNSNGSGSDSGNGSAGSPSSGDILNADTFRSSIDTALRAEGVTSTAAWDDPASYQAQALSWLITDSDGKNHHQDRIHQRYAMAAFYFATNGAVTVYSPDGLPWNDSTGWLSDQHECSWSGVICSEFFKVTGISLSENEVTGALPMELVLIKDHLQTLDFTENKIYMSGAQLEVFAKLKKLKKIVMSDNYVLTDNGLPSAMGECTDLEQLELSYNLLEGPISGALLSRWTKLTHLEVESNYLSGSLPAELGFMSQLVYLYLRRNSFNTNLDFLHSGNMNNLFSMWLDDNTLMGNIPTEIGLATELASLSLSNSTLTGKIPSELGGIVGLRRVWLYKNQLTGGIPSQIGNLPSLEVFEVQDNLLVGQMPQPVCATVRASDYEHKSLLADCSQVACSNCCSRCL